MLLKMKYSVPILLLCQLQLVTSLVCYWNSRDPYRYFSSKTPYNMLRGDIRDSLIKFTDCEPVSIWGLMRHGKRSPGATYVRQMKEVMFIRNYVVASYDNGTSSLCAQDVDNLRNWKPDEGIFNKVNQLTEEGYQEMVGIGRRLRQAFPILLKELNFEDYIFRSVKDSWIEDSIKGFVEGLANQKLKIDSPKVGYDNIAPYAACRKYKKDVKHSSVTYEEAKKYHINSEFLVLKDRIQRRLGMHYPLTDDNIIAMWDICRYTSSGIENKFSPWCALFNKEDLKILEYEGDLNHYYRNGHGSSINKLFGEIVLSELVKSFRDAKEGVGRKITTYVTHSTMMDMVYSALGLFKDETHLTGAKRNPDRKWRTSKFSIFSNNLIAVLNKCGEDYFNVVFYLNEEPLKTICNEGVCTWKEFEDKLSPFLTTNADFC